MNKTIVFLNRYRELTEGIRAAFGDGDIAAAGRLVEERGALVDGFKKPPDFFPGPEEQKLYDLILKAEAEAGEAARGYEETLKLKMRDMAKIKSALIRYNEAKYL